MLELGRGRTGISLLNSAQIAVTFKDIVVNTDNRLVEGFFETKYDTKNNNLLFDADQYQTGGKGVGDIRSGEEQAAFKVDYTINPDIKALPVKADGTKDEIKEGTDYTISKGENGKYTFILTDSEGNEHKVEADEMPATIQDRDGNTYQVNEKGEVTKVQQDDNFDTEESKTKIGDGDTSVYIEITEREVGSNAKNTEVARYYENNETIILAPGKYKFRAYRKYVEVRETDSLKYDPVQVEALPSVIKDIKDLNILSLTSDRTAYIRENGEKNKDFITIPYLWKINSTEHDGANDVEYTFNNSGNYTLSVQTRTAQFQRAKVVSSATTGSNEKVEDGGWIRVEGLPDMYKLNIMVLDPEPVYFMRGDNYKGEYGFDNFEKTELKASYKTLEIKKAGGDTIQYVMPYMSLSTDNTYTIQTSTMVKKDYLDGVEALEKSAKKEKKDKPAAYTFTATDGVSVNGNQTYNVYRESLQKDKSNKTPLQIRRTGIHSYDSPDTVTVRDVTGKIVGKMIVICANVDKSENINLIKVYLGSDRTLNNDKSPATLLNEAITFMNNKAYNQLFVEFKGDKSAELIISDEEIENINKDKGGKSQIINENGEIKVQPTGRCPERAVIATMMENDGRFDKWTGKTIIVIANRNKEMEGNSRTAGFANIDQETHTGTDFILYYSGSVDYTTYTHELGHLFGLGEAFDEGSREHDLYNIKEGTSHNFMDYSPVTNMFWKWQWDELRENIGKPNNGQTKTN